MTIPDLFYQPDAKYQSHSDTSYESAREITDRLNKYQEKVFMYLHERGTRGSTDKEGYTILDMAQNNYRPRRIELWDEGLVVFTPARRDKCAVWKLKKFATEDDLRADNEYRRKKDE